MTTLIYYLINRNTKEVKFAGRLPDTYGQISGLTPDNYEGISNLDMWGADYEGLGFVTYEHAMEQGVSTIVLDEAKKGAIEIEWRWLEPQRANKIADVRWRIERYDDAVALGIEPVEPKEPLLRYVQAIRDLTMTCSDPFNIVWPTVPALPAKA